MKVVELNYLYLNLRFDMCVIFMANYFFSRRRRFHQQQDTLGDRLRES
jgi:hypothetical protein